MVEVAKIRILFENTNYPELKQTIAALEVQHDVNKMTFVQITNHLATMVSKFENKQANLRGVASAKVGNPEQNNKGSKNGGVREHPGSLFIRF